MTEITDAVNGYETAVALGYFDGMHIGHKKVINEIIGRDGLESVVFTFMGNARLPKQSEAEGYCITSFDEKKKLIEEMGADHLFAPDFDKIKDFSPEGFVCDVLKNKLKASFVVCGYDFTFGREAAGTSQLLSVLCNKNGIECKIVPAVIIDGNPVSSTLIRTMIKNGEIAGANRFLGRELSYTLLVEKGNQLGRTIGFPTINQYIPAFIVRPKNGVYASFTEIDGVTYKSITNVGVKPTVQSDGIISAETHILDFDGDLYGKEVTVKLRFYIRAEKRFNDLEELRAQITDDLEYSAS